jgi:hypothetical protein
MTVGIRRADHVAPLYQQKLALTQPTSGGCSVCIDLSWTQATGFSFSVVYHWFTIHNKEWVNLYNDEIKLLNCIHYTDLNIQQ